MKIDNLRWFGVVPLTLFVSLVLGEAADVSQGRSFQALKDEIEQLKTQNLLLVDELSDLAIDLGDANDEISYLGNQIVILQQGAGSGSSSVGFVGFSDETFQGDGGFSNMTQACIDTFGEGARMALTTERLKSGLMVTGHGWANPIGIGWDNGENPVIWDDSGVSKIGRLPFVGKLSLNCENWRHAEWSKGVVGSIIGEQGSSSTWCYVALPAACSAPQ